MVSFAGKNNRNFEDSDAPEDFSLLSKHSSFWMGTWAVEDAEHNQYIIIPFPGRVELRATSNHRSYRSNEKSIELCHIDSDPYNEITFEIVQKLFQKLHVEYPNTTHQEIVYSHKGMISRCLFKIYRFVKRFKGDTNLKGIQMNRNFEDISPFKEKGIYQQYHDTYFYYYPECGFAGVLETYPIQYFTDIECNHPDKYWIHCGTMHMGGRCECPLDIQSPIPRYQYERADVAYLLRK